MKNLYIVSTPIGNLQDISLRGAKTLLSVSYVITESASKTNNLLNFVRQNFPNISNSSSLPKIVSYSEDEEDTKLASMIRIIEVNDTALVSEAGTPLISDPGYKLVREAIRRGINIIPIPGPTAATAALTASGLPPDKFLFLGYLPKKEGKRLESLENLKKIRPIVNATVIIYESPHRLIESFQAIQDVFGDIDIVIARELTKIHEEVRREKVSNLIMHFEKISPRGEFVILL